ncbi:hypothetical protein P792_14450 [Asaia sp. SF2.1]|nr:hypothetical protein P792_14450 [Asaia sp. SF2.1]
MFLLVLVRYQRPCGAKRAQSGLKKDVMVASARALSTSHDERISGQVVQHVAHDTRDMQRCHY